MRYEENRNGREINQWSEELTLRELLEMTINTENEKLPTVKQLRDSGADEFCRINTDSFELVVYRNGFFTYSNGRHATVQSIHQCRKNLEYNHQAGTTVLGFDLFADKPYAYRLLLEGEERLAHNQEMRMRKHVYTYDNMPMGSDDLKDETDFTEIHAGQEERKSLLRSIRQTFPGLTEKQRKIVWLYYFEERSQRQIALEMDCTKQAVSESIRYAVQKIQKKLGVPPKNRANSHYGPK